MRNRGAPPSSRLLFADAKSSFSAAESSPEEDPAAEFDWGGGRSLWVALFRASAAGGVVSAADGPATTANIEKEIGISRRIILWGTFRHGGCRQSSAFHLS